MLWTTSETLAVLMNQNIFLECLDVPLVLLALNSIIVWDQHKKIIDLSSFTALLTHPNFSSVILNR